MLVGAIDLRWARDKRCSSWGYRRSGACEGNRVQEVGCGRRRDLWLPKYVQIEMWRSCRDEETRTDAQIEPVRTVRDSKRIQVWGEPHTTAASPRRQIPLKPLGETTLYPKRRQKPRTSVGGSSIAIMIGLRDMIDNPDMTSSLGLCGGKLGALNDHKV